MVEVITMFNFSNLKITNKAIQEIENKYNAIFLKGYQVPQELLGQLQKDEVAVFASLDEIGDKTQILLALKHIFDVGAYLYVIDNDTISTAQVEVVEKLIRLTSIVGNDELMELKKPIVDTISSYIEDELVSYDIPENFNIYYWKYELGEMKLLDICEEMKINKPYFYRMCDVYETTINFYKEQYSKSVDLILSPKKRETDYTKIVDIFHYYKDKGLTNEALMVLQKEFSVSWFNLWRLLLAFRKSRFYLNTLKDDVALKNSEVIKDLKSILKYIAKNPEEFLEYTSMDYLRRKEPENRIANDL